MKPLKLLLLASGRGSHVVNLIQATRDGRIAGEICRVVCDRPGAPVLERAAALGVRAVLLEPATPGARLHPDAERRLTEIVREDRPDLVALCGFMRLLSAALLDQVNAPVVNVHPSLLPAFRGLHAQRQALEAGVRVTGATVHYVDAGMDSGPIILQAALDVRPEDSEESLSERLLPLEHRLYVDAIHYIQRGAVRREGRAVHIDPTALESPAPEGADRRK